MNIKSVIENTYQTARRASFDMDSKQTLNQKRSLALVEALGNAFLKEYSDDSRVKVFWKGNPAHRAAFGMNEFLYDVAVCKTATVESAVHKKILSYVTEALWLVESELAKNSRQAVIDFNKLVIGRSTNKLFVGPQVTDNQAFLQVLASPAALCEGVVYTALVPYPAEWDHPKTGVEVWIWDKKQWAML